MMKRIIPLILALFFVVGCSKDSGDDQDNSKDVVVNEPKPIDDNTTPSTNTPINDATPSIDGNSLNANIVANYNSLEIDGKTYNIKYVDTKSDSRISVPYSIKASSNTSTSKVCILQDKGTKVKLGFDENDELEIYQWVNDELEYVGVLTTNAADLSEDKTTGTFSGSLSLNLDIDIDDVTLVAWIRPKDGWLCCYLTLDEAINKGIYLLSYNFKYNPEGNSEVVMRALSSAFLEILTERTTIDLVVENGDNKYEYEDVIVTDGKLYVSIITGAYVTSTALGLNRQLIKDPKIYRVNRLTGVFSVGSGTTDKVHFSKGNLQYTVGSGYHFADNQYDYIGKTSANQNCTGTFDLFCWGTGDNPAQTEVSVSSFVDWGGYIELDKNWFTLSKVQWNYLFNKRVTTSGIRYAKAQVNGINGVIILPDDWSASTHTLSNTNTHDVAFTINTIDEKTWPTLESAGAVFLPAAGSRSGTYVDYVGSSGSYWSSTGVSGSFASCWYFSFVDVVETAGYRDGGRSVRLVRGL